MLMNKLEFYKSKKRNVSFLPNLGDVLLTPPDVLDLHNCAY